MFHIALYEPEIPPNTGNIIRLTANAGCRLHLIHPLGFPLDDAKMRRAGLDYHEFAQRQEHVNYADFKASLPQARIFACTTKGAVNYTDVHYQPDDVLLFGPETRGLPLSVLEDIPNTQRIRIPMLPHSRSLNLSNAVAIIVYEAWRQNQFGGYQ